MTRITGLGGIFFKAKDPKTIMAWYQKHLQLPDGGGAIVFEWRDARKPEEKGQAVWSIFKADTRYFDPSGAPFMINYRVADLHRVLGELSAEGVTVDQKIDESEYGEFGWVMDSEWNRIEPWEPPRSVP